MSRADPRSLTTTRALTAQRQLDRAMVLFDVASRRIAACVGGEVASATHGASDEYVDHDAGGARERVASLVVILRCGCRHLVEMRGGFSEDALTHACREHRPPTYGPCLPQPTDAEVDSIPF